MRNEVKTLVNIPDRNISHILPLHTNEFEKTSKYVDENHEGTHT
jgi:hypothetical protein